MLACNITVCSYIKCLKIVDRSRSAGNAYTCCYIESVVLEAVTPAFGWHEGDPCLYQHSWRSSVGLLVLEKMTPCLLVDFPLVNGQQVFILVHFCQSSLVEAVLGACLPRSKPPISCPTLEVIAVTSLCPERCQVSSNQKSGGGRRTAWNTAKPRGFVVLQAARVPLPGSQKPGALPGTLPRANSPSFTALLVAPWSQHAGGESGHWISVK